MNEPVSNICYVNGEYVAAEEAKVSAFDHGFLYGDGHIARRGLPPAGPQGDGQGDARRAPARPGPSARDGFELQGEGSGPSPQDGGGAQGAI